MQKKSFTSPPFYAKRCLTGKIKSEYKTFSGRIRPMEKVEGWIIGIDEVGRGPLAGPVTVCATLIPKKRRFFADLGVKLRDSKKLSPKQRELWSEWAREKQKNKELFYELQNISPHVIDRINITQASYLAATRAIRKLYKRLKLKDCSVYIYLDGGLHIDEDALRELHVPKKNVKTVIKGDEKIPAVSIASIIAKVFRDAYMVKLHIQYPQYGFHMHKGYGTEKHRGAIRRYGPSKMHRLTFCKNFYTIKK